MSSSSIPPLSAEELGLDRLAGYGTCAIADAIETFDVRLRNRGHSQPGLRCMTSTRGAIAGYAITARMRSSDPPMVAHSYVPNDAWWQEIEQAPKPRIIVIEDIDPQPGQGACAGAVTAAIFQRLDCRGLVTNGSVRDVPAVTEMQFPMFAASLSPSHAYAHWVEHSQRVSIFGLEITPGDLLVADLHGVVSIPLELAPRLPSVIQEIECQKRRIFDFCRSSEFSVERLQEQMQQLRP